MAEFASHTPGTFAWAELATSDQRAGVAFYRALLGWDVNEQPIGPTEVYSMFMLRGKEMAAALCWSELSTRDTKAAEAFYTKLFGWTAKHGAPSATMEYTEFSIQGRPGMGMMAMPAQVPAGVPSYWMPYFQVADCDASAVKAKQLGATIMVPPHDIPKTGRFSIMTDPQGAMFAVFKFTGAA